MDHELDDIGQRDSDDGPPEAETSFGKDVQTVSTGGAGTAGTSDTRIRTGLVEDYYEQLDAKYNRAHPIGFYTINFEVAEGKLRLIKYPTVDLYGRRGSPLAPSTIAREINKVGGKGALAVYHLLGYDISKSRATPALLKVEQLTAAAGQVDNLPLQELPGVLEHIHDQLKAVETQTGGFDETGEFTRRELVSLYESLATRRGQFKLLASKAMVNEETAEGKKERLKTAEGTEKQLLEQELAQLQDEHDALMNQAADLRGLIHSQIETIKDSFKQLLDGSKTIGERLKDLFREQGITIASVLAAIGLLIGVLVEAFGGAAAVAGAAGGGGPAAQSWIKKQLEALRNLLSRLAGKALDALPGIIGAIFSWLLNFLSKTAGWLADNVWAIVVAAAGVVYMLVSKSFT